jgi:hypothetical protein
MSVSNYTALIISSRDDIVATAGGPTKDGKFVGWITLGQLDRFRPLLNTEPIYNTKEEAVVAMKKIIEEIQGKPTIMESCPDGTKDWNLDV